MDVDAKSESESEDEVRTPWPQQPCRNNFWPRQRSSSHRVRWNSLKRAGV